MTRLAAFSFLLIACACAGVPKPDADICIVNAPALHRKCYNLATDFNDDGTLKAGAVAVFRSNQSVADLNKALVVDSKDGFEEGLARVKAYIKKLREAAQSSSQCQ